MNRIEFMKELEYLLQDIPDEEKADALDYYRDYLEEAGDEKEADVLQEFGSPERIAAMIRSDLHGGMESGGEFTEHGFQDSRFEDPRYRLANRLDLPEAQAGTGRTGERTSSDDRERTGGKHQASESSLIQRSLKIFLIFILLCLTSPFILGFGGTMIGVFAAVLAVIAAVAISIAAVTFAFFVAAFALLAAGIVQLFTVPAQGLLLLGIGIVFLGLALLGLIAAILFYGKLIPVLVRACVDFVSGLFRRRGSVRS